MDKDISKSVIDEIITLHDEIATVFRKGLKNALKIGQLLTKQKKQLQHGEFTTWVEENLPFTPRRLSLLQ